MNEKNIFNNSTIYCKTDDIKLVRKLKSRCVGTIKQSEKSFFGLNKRNIYFVEFLDGGKSNTYSSIEKLLNSLNNSSFHQYVVKNNNDVYEPTSVIVITTTQEYRSFFETEKEADEYIKTLPLNEMNTFTYKCRSY